jgi:hypothetical protein
LLTANRTTVQGGALVGLKWGSSGAIVGFDGARVELGWGSALGAQYICMSKLGDLIHPAQFIFKSGGHVCCYFLAIEIVPTNFRHILHSLTVMSNAMLQIQIARSQNLLPKLYQDSNLIKYNKIISTDDS